MGNELQALVTILSMLEALAQLDSAFYNATAAYMRMRRDIIRAIICDSPRVQRQYQPYAERRFWVRPGRTSAWWDNFVNDAVAPGEWRDNFRMSRSSLVDLSERLRPHVEGARTKMRAPVGVLAKVACTLYYLSGEGRLQITATAFGLSRQVVSVIVRQVCKAVTVFLGPDFIATPKAEADVRDLVAHFHWTHGVPQCLGAVGCTHVHVKPPRVKATDYINGMGTYSLNVQALCDYRHRFLDVVVKWPGGAHDAHVFARSELSGDLRDGTIPPCPQELVQGEDPIPVFLLGGPAYPLKPYLMKEYADGGTTEPERRCGLRLRPRLREARAAIEPERRCALRLREAHATIRRSFGRLKARFAALRRTMDINMEDLPFVIYACFVLHNYCEANGETVNEQSVEAALQHDMGSQPPGRAASVGTDDDEAEGERVRRVLTQFFDHNEVKL